MKIMNIGKNKDNLKEKDIYNFNPYTAKKEIVNWIKEWFAINGHDCNAVIGISGGKDSSIVAALCVEALGKDKVIGVLMPQGEQKDISLAKKLVDILGIKSYEINIEEAVNSIINPLKYYNNLSVSEQTRINLPARIRMSTLYAVAQSVNGRVVGTSNLSETVVGYYTLGGDSVSAMFPIKDYTVTEVQLIGVALGLPDDLIYKVPEDGLSGKTDEENLGFSYDELDNYIRKGDYFNEETYCKIEKLAKNSAFKLRLPEKCNSYLPNCVESFEG